MTSPIRRSARHPPLLRRIRVAAARHAPYGEAGRRDEPGGEAMEEERELTLDPADWDEFGRLAHRMLDDTLRHLATLRGRPVWQPMPDEVRGAFQAPLPRSGSGDAAAYDDFARLVRPYPNGNLHPRFWGWVQG